MTPNFTMKSDLFSDIAGFEEEDNYALITATQESEEQGQKHRFCSIMTVRDVQCLLQSAVPKTSKVKINGLSIYSKSNSTSPSCKCLTQNLTTF